MSYEKTQRRIDEFLEDMDALEKRITKKSTPEEAEEDQVTFRSTLQIDDMEYRIPPEKRSELAMAKKRIKAAAEFFNRNFDVNGNPITKFGKKLSKMYERD
jgi:hypothetical protein